MIKSVLSSGRRHFSQSALDVNLHQLSVEYTDFVSIKA